jgi:ketosteroid isomerase-like protein
MIDAIMREFARAFCDALASHDPNLIAPWLDDDIDWTIYGPIDLFPFFGQRRGKAAVLAMCGAIDSCLALKSCEKDSRLIDGARAAALIKLAAVHKPTGRTLSLRMAMFAEVRDGKLARLRAVFDTFDAAEQALGREIDLSAAA